MTDILRIYINGSDVSPTCGGSCSCWVFPNKEPPDILPFNARLLYYAQCAWGSGSLQEDSQVAPAARLKLLEAMFQDCAGTIQQYMRSDRALRKQKDIEVEFEMFYISQFNQQWTHCQVAIAEYLDTFSELSARLESLQAFADLCESKGVKSSRELLPDSNAEPGLYLLPVSDEF